MGAAQSTSEEEQLHEQLLTRLSGPASIPFGQPLQSGQHADSQQQQQQQQQRSEAKIIPLGTFWDELLGAFKEPLLTLPPATIDDKLRAACEQLLVHNPLTHNFQALVLHTVTLLSDARDVRSRRTASNALRLITQVLLVASSTGNGASLVTSLFAVTPNLPIPQDLAASAGPSQLLRLLVRRCLALTTTLPANGSGYLLLLELMHLLLALLASSQLGASHVRGPPGSHPGVEAACSMPALAPRVVSRLLHLYTYRPGPPETLLHLCQPTPGTQPAHQPQQGTSIPLGAVASAASALLWLPVTALGGVVSMAMGSSTGAATPGSAYGTSSGSVAMALPHGGLGPGHVLSPSPVADLSLLLLLLLLHAPDQAPLGFNPYKYALRGLVNKPDSELHQQLSQPSFSAGLKPQPSAGSFGPGYQVRPQGDSSQDPPWAAPEVCFASLYMALSQHVEAPALLAATRSSSGSAAAQGVTPSPSPRSALGQGASSGSVVVAWTCGAPLLSSGPEEAVSLLYLLLVNSQEFKDFVASHTDKRRLLVPLLHQLWTVSPAQQPRLLFMLQILLLILSQDDRWATSLHHVTLPSGVAWCRELAKGVTLGSLMVMVLLRVINMCWSLNPINDLTAPTNALAALANLAPHAKHLHARAAQRLLALLGALTKKYTRMGGLQTLASGTPLPLAAALAGGGGSGSAQAVAAQQQAALTVVEDFIHIVLEIINLSLTGPSNPVVVGSMGSGVGAAGLLGQGAEAVARSGQLASNVELVYALLHQQDTVSALRAHPRLGELADNLHRVVAFFNYRLDAASGSASLGRPEGASLLPTCQPGTPGTSVVQGTGGWSSADQVLRVLAGSVLDWRHDRVRSFPQLKFAYEEEQEPDAFFVPLVWSLVLQRCGSLAWSEAQLSLAHPGGPNGPWPPPEGVDPGIV